MAYFYYLYYMFTGFYIFQIVRNNKVLHSQDWLLIALILVIFYNVITLTFMKNKKLIGIFLCYTIVVLYYKGISFLYIKELMSKLVNYMNEPFLYTEFGRFLTLSLIYGIIMVKKNPNKENKKEKELFEERKNDKEYIKGFLMNDLMKDEEQNILGIDDQFGEGKTFLVNEVIKSLDSDKFEIIKIRCLLLDADNVYSYIIKQLNRVLVNNFVFSGHIDRLKSGILKGLESKVLIGLSDVFVRESSVDDIENFKKAISNLNKTIVLIFDDLDRSSDEIKLEKLFSFISDFSQGNVKSLVLFNSNNLKLINEKFNRAYIEKYIPLIRAMTELEFNKILEKEIKNNNLEKEEFDFLFSIFSGDHNIILTNYEKNIKILKFKLDFQELVLQSMISHTKWTPRNIENFIQELKTYFSMEDLKIEKRIMVAFTFLKILFYEDFYEKITLNFSFERDFPINLKLLAFDINITLEQLDIVKAIIKNKKNLFEKKETSYIDIGEHRIFFDEKYRGEHINNYLELFKLPILKENTREEIFAAIGSLEKMLGKTKIKVMEDSYTNIVIYELFNYFLISTTNKYVVKENNDTIEKAIKKLKFLGKKEYLSSYRRYYEKLKLCLVNKDKEKQKESYMNLLKEYYNNARSFEEKTMNILNVFEDDENKLKYLELIYYKAKNKITDGYLSAFFASNLKKVEIQDFIIEKLLNNNFIILDRNTLNLIRNNISKLITRVKLLYVDAMVSLENVEFYQQSISYLNEMLKDGSYHNLRYKSVINSPVIRKYIKRYIEFLALLIKLEKDENIKEKEMLNIRMETKLPEDLEKIKKIKDKAEQLKEMERLFIEGKDIDSLKYYNED